LKSSCPTAAKKWHTIHGEEKQTIHNWWKAELEQNNKQTPQKNG
jgi:hypothetical protein